MNNSGMKLKYDIWNNSFLIILKYKRDSSTNTGLLKIFFVPSNCKINYLYRTAETSVETLFITVEHEFHKEVLATAANCR